MDLTDEDRDGFSPEQLPGYVSPAYDRKSAPNIYTTILHNKEDADQLSHTNQEGRSVSRDVDVNMCNSIGSSQERFEELMREHESIKAAYLDIEECIQRDQEKQNMPGDCGMTKSGFCQLSRIPLPIYMYQAYPKTEYPTVGYPKVRPSLYKPSRIPVLIGPVSSQTMSPKQLPYSIYHNPGKHITTIPETLDSLMRDQDKTDLPVCVKKLDKSLPRSTEFVVKSRIPVAVSRIPVRKSRIPVAVSITQVGKSRIPMTVSRIPVGKLRIPAVAVSRIPVPKSRIPVAVSRIPVGKSRIPAAVSPIPVRKSRNPVAVSRIPVRKSRIPVAVSRIPVQNSRMSVAVSGIPVRNSRIPLIESRINDMKSETKVSPLKKVKKVTLKKLSNISPSGGFPSLDKFFKMLFDNNAISPLMGEAL